MLSPTCLGHFRRIRMCLDKRLIQVHERPVEKAMLSTSAPVAIVYTMALGVLLLSYSFDNSIIIRKQSIIRDNDDMQVHEPEIE